MQQSPERYNDEEILPTYLETAAISIYCHGPVGTAVFKDFFKKSGTQTTLAFVKPHHWCGLTQHQSSKTHLLVLRDPIQQHRHAAWLHGMSIHEVNRKRENMFYHTHLAPHLSIARHGEFDFYIDFDKLSRFLFDYEPPREPILDTQMLDQRDELDAYEWIKENKMELNTAQWRDLILRGQLEGI